MARLVAAAGIAMLCMFSHVVTDMELGIWLKRVSLNSARLIAICSLLIFLVPLLNGVQEARTFMRQNSEPFSHLPQDLTDYLIASGKKGRILNQY